MSTTKEYLDYVMEQVNAVETLMPDAPYELPYEGAKLMPIVEDIENKELLERVITTMYEELPAPKPKKAKKR